MEATIFAKTAAGQAELAHRQLKLTARQRSLLVVVDGMRPVSALRSLLSGADGVGEGITQLQALGLIEPVLRSQVPEGGAEQADVIQVSASLDQAPDAQSCLKLYQIYIQVINEVMGLRGFASQLKLEKAQTRREYLDLGNQLAAALAKGRGVREAREFVAQAQVLLE